MIETKGNIFSNELKIYLFIFQKATEAQKQYWSDVGILDILTQNMNRIYYDSIMLIALALNRSIEDLQKLKPPRKLEDFTYNDVEFTEVLNSNVRHVEEFQGLSVRVQIYKTLFYQ